MTAADGSPAAPSRMNRSQTAPGAAGRDLEHRESPDHRPVCRLLHEAIFDPQFRIAQPEGAWAIGGENGSGRQDRMQVQIGCGAPVKLNRGTDRVGLYAGAVRRGKRIEFIMSEFNRFGVIRLKRRACEASGHGA